MCLKPGKSTGPDRCPNELTKKMTDEEFQFPNCENVGERNFDRRNKSTANNNEQHHFAASQRWRHELNVGPTTSSLAKQRVSTAELCRQCQWLVEKIVEPANILEPGQGGGRQGRCVGINMQKVHRDFMFIELTLTLETPSTPWLKQRCCRWWGCFKFQMLTYSSRCMKAPRWS